MRLLAYVCLPCPLVFFVRATALHLPANFFCPGCGLPVRRDANEDVMTTDTGLPPGGV